MLIFMVPIFAKIFEDLGATLPLPTRVEMGTSDLLTSIFGVTHMIAVGEEIGDIGGMLQKLAGFYESELDRRKLPPSRHSPRSWSR